MKTCFVFYIFEKMSNHMRQKMLAGDCSKVHLNKFNNSINYKKGVEGWYRGESF